MSSPSVPKPASAKDGVLSIAKTTSSFANIRSGPGTQYADIGDLFNNSAVTQYPQSNMGGWVWIEQPGSAGWVSTSVVSFTPVNTQPVNTSPTPYDGKIAIWHWKGTAIPETTIAQLAQNVRKNTPNVRQLWVKVGDGNAWQGKFDSGDMAINGPADIDRWVTTLGQYGLEFHAWVVLKGVDIQGEANIMVAVGQRPGVKSIIMDVEPYEGYWKAGPQPIRPLMTMVRQGLGNNFHIGLCIDPRKAHYETVYPNEWKPFVDSVHTMSYWRTFRKTVAATLQETYQIWGGFGKPIIPILQGDAPLIEQQEAHMIATQQFKAKGLSWWRYGDTPQWAAVNTPIPGVTTSPPDTGGGITTDLTNTPPQGTAFAEEKVIFFGAAGHRSGTYTGQPEYKETSGAMTWKFSYTSTQETTSKVWSEWKTTLPADGIYQISVFIPAKNATTKKARYKIHGIRGTNTEVVVDLNQSIYRNVWVSLGIFDLVKTQENAGKVFLNDVTGEKDREIAFDAVRVRRIVPITNNNTNPNPGVPVADGFDSPVFESLADAQGTILWPTGWRDATGFGRKTAAAYISNNRAYHPGVDLNLGSWDQDRGKPVYATASGVVIFQGDMRIWGNVTVIRHDPLRTADGAIYYSRYGHMQNVTVKVGDRVKRGQKIGEVGKGFGNFAAHLHFDIVRTTALERYAGDWPGMDLARIERDYVDPLEFIRNNRPKR
jgi:murein DD-endopeptidase MepM/ murein hydrolase activator NlpD